MSSQPSNQPLFITYSNMDIMRLVPQSLTPELRSLLWVELKSAFPGFVAAFICYFVGGTEHLLGVGLYLYFFKFSLPKLIGPLFRLLRWDGPSGRELGDMIFASLPLLTYVATAFGLVQGNSAWEYSKILVKDSGNTVQILVTITCGIAPGYIYLGDEFWPSLVYWYKKFREVDERMKLYKTIALLTVFRALYAVWARSKCILLHWGALLLLLFKRFGSQSQSMEYFQHERFRDIRDIRLLKLSRRSLFSTSLTAKMMHVSLDDAPLYDAISYRWDDPRNIAHITINGLQYNIPRSAFTVLQERCSFWRTRLIWIDSVCINQKNEDEKAQQIELMRDIYRNASRVVVWLGDGRDAHLIGSLLDELAWMRLTSDKGVLAERVQREYMTERNSPRWAAFRELLSQQWFERIWVVQELALARRVDAVYGGRYLDWSLFVDVMEIFHAGGKMDSYWLLKPNVEQLTRGVQPIAPGHVLLMKIFQDGVSKGFSQELVGLLFLTHSFKATEPKDKVFALLGLAAKDSYVSMNLDYRESVQETYTKVASYLLMEEAVIMMVLNFAGCGYHREVPEIPSWVPDWSITPGAQPLALPSENQYDASKGRSPCIHRGKTRATISVTGIHVDQIAALGLVLSGKRGVSEKDGTKSAQTLSWHEEAHELANRLLKDPYQAKQQALSEAFWRTLIGDFDTTNTYRPAPESYAEDYVSWQHVMRKRVPESFKNTDHESVDHVLKCSRFNLALGLCADGRRFCITKAGFMGLVPEGSQIGDEICVFEGGQTPFVLRANNPPIADNREKDQHEVYYLLVGEAYFHGMMDGEMFVDGVEVQNIVLC